MNNNCIMKFRGGMAARVILGSLAAFALLGGSEVYAQEKEKTRDDKEQIDFSLIPNPVTPPPLLRQWEAICFWPAMRLVLRAMSASPKMEAFPGPSMELGLKLRFLPLSSESLSRLSPTFSATTTIPRRRNRWLLATRLGRVRSTAAKCGQLQLPQQQLLPARTRVARIRVPLPACC
jgi:hypothetical protein